MKFKELNVNNMLLYFLNETGNVEIEIHTLDCWAGESVSFDDLERWVIATRKQLVREGR